MKENNLIGIITWIVGVLVALAVGSGMIDGTLIIPGISNIGKNIIVVIAGYVVVVGAILSVILAIFNK